MKLQSACRLSSRSVLMLTVLILMLAQLSLGADLSFRGREEYRTGDRPEVAAIVDLNGDGFKDLLLLEGGKSLRLLTGDPQGRFHAASLTALRMK